MAVVLPLAVPILGILVLAFGGHEYSRKRPYATTLLWLGLTLILGGLALWSSLLESVSENSDTDYGPLISGLGVATIGSATATIYVALVTYEKRRRGRA